jgi:ketosteroid isomerase-like protein
MTGEQVADWIAAYERAWRTPGTDTLEQLFTEDASYRQGPYDEPVAGLPAIRLMWEAEREGPDEEFRLTSEVVVAGAGTAVARLHVRYGDPSFQEWRNLWVLRFTEDGRCEAFEEWPMAPPAA